MSTKAMIYRDGRTIYFPNDDGTFQAQTFKSINLAKREVREKRLTVRRGKPPVRSTAAVLNALDGRLSAAEIAACAVQMTARQAH